MKKYILAIIVLIIVTTGYLLNKKEYYKITGYAQGTSYSVIYSTYTKINLTDSIENILKHFDLTFSSYISNSIISGINRNDTTVLTNDMFDYIFDLSNEISELTGGAFDITVAPLVNAWGFGWKSSKTIDQTMIDSLLEIVGMEKVNLENRKVIKKDPRVEIDVNAIAQGYSVDVIADYLDKLGIKNYLVEVGGEVKGKGKNQNRDIWKVAIEKPVENNNPASRPLQAAIKLKNSSLATSGNYRSFYEKDGVKFVHTINPRTGQTIQSNLLSASVMTGECARADALATAFMVLGLEKSIDLVSKINDVDVYFIYTDTAGNFKEWSTPGFKAVFSGNN